MKSHHNTTARRIFSSDPNKTVGQEVAEAKNWIEFINGFRVSNGGRPLPKDAWKKVVVPR